MSEYRGYNIEGDGTFGMKIIKTIGRGSLPMELRGNFTSDGSARRSIDLVIIGKEKADNGEVVIGN